MSAEEITTILGRGSSFTGKLTFEGAVRIEGEFSGEIRTQGKLIVGESAQVSADVHAAVVVVEGSVKGDIVATEALEIRAPARVFGNIQSPVLAIERGAIFEGASKMQPSPVAVAANQG